MANVDSTGASASSPVTALNMYIFFISFFVMKFRWPYKRHGVNILQMV